MEPISKGRLRKLAPLITCGLYRAKTEKDIDTNLKSAFDLYLDLGDGEHYAKGNAISHAANVLKDNFFLQNKEEALRQAKEQCLIQFNQEKRDRHEKQ